MVTSVHELLRPATLAGSWALAAATLFAITANAQTPPPGDAPQVPYAVSPDAPPPEAPPPPLPPPPPPPAAQPPPLPAEAPQPAAARSLWALGVTALGAYYTIHPPPPNLRESGGQGAGTLELDRYFDAVVDDDAPRSLQPFLQRASTLYVEAQGSGYSTRYRVLTELESISAYRKDGAFVGTVGVNGYVTPWFALTGALTYGYDVIRDANAMIDAHTHTFGIAAGFGPSSRTTTRS